MSSNVVWHKHEVNKVTRADSLNQQPRVIWLTGLSGSGKSTMANLLEKKLHAQGKHTYLLDGDNIRHGLCGDLGFSDKDRVENIRRISEVAKLFVDAGVIVLTAFISPFQADRTFCRSLLSEGEFVEVFVDTPLEVCEQRDPKGLYKKARNGEIKHFTGIDSAYEAPSSPEIHLTYREEKAEETAERLFNLLLEKGLV
ncbi:adenylyl-sulfate kinase [Alteromonas pelagimontana]|uniref:Adenylyl-sulfate kinase n=1 Tax=Alteromonas pelagimontana TaxID=1858656 RepID=A0A6M4M9U4_9ALTE|nr:adenylyl-sulfate kinase [Alteromonas pelagimontana]QJR79877.1 adenylyl-sulfate kinase [Alteromonas pelagimontana]